MHEPTHIQGHTLDVIITQNSGILVSKIKVNMKISDHLVVHFDTYIQKPPSEWKRITFRKLKAIDSISFKDDLKNITVTLPMESAAAGLVNLYHILHFGFF